MPTRGSKFAIVRAYVLLVGGLAIIGWEVILEKADRPTIIVAALLMMGITVPLNLDEKAKRFAEIVRSPNQGKREKEETENLEGK